jgi:hypothetical protein
MCSSGWAVEVGGGDIPGVGSLPIVKVLSVFKNYEK